MFMYVCMCESMYVVTVNSVCVCMRVHVCVHVCITFMYLCKFGLFVWVCVKGGKVSQ